VSGLLSKLKTLLCSDDNFLPTKEVAVLMVSGSVADAHVVEYVLVSVQVSKLETLHHCCTLNWRYISVGRSSSASPRKLIHVTCGSLSSASRVGEGLSSLKV
jgi:hypothetical protein